MKKITFLMSIVLSLSLVLAGCGSGQSAQPNKSAEQGYPVMKLTVAALDSADTAKTHDLELFTKLVTEKSGGNIKFEIFYNSQLGAPTANLNTIGSGVADLGTVCTLYTPSNLPLSQITYCMPFAPSDPALAGKLMYKISEKHPVFYQEYEKNNVVNLGWKGNEPYKLYSKNPITSLTQLKGLKLTLGGVYYIPWFESVGAVPVSAPAAELYQTIKSGVAFGSFVYDSIYCNFKLYEVEKNSFDVGMGARNNDTICINKNVWNSLNDKTKALFKECANEAMDTFQKWEQGKMDSWTTEMKNNGVQFTKMSQEDKALWAKTALTYKDTLQSWIKDATAAGYDGATIMSDYLKIGEELGYTWSFDTSVYKK